MTKKADETAPPPPWHPPATAAMFGPAEYLDVLYRELDHFKSPIARGSFDLAADNAAFALFARGSQMTNWMDRYGDHKDAPELDQARARLYTYLLANDPALVTSAFWKAAEGSLKNRDPACVLVVHLDTRAELELLRQRAPWTVTILLAETFSSASALPVPDGPASFDATIGVNPFYPPYMPDGRNKTDYTAAWRKAMVERIVGVATESYTREVF
jgi:hypothetical protein